MLGPRRSLSRPKTRGIASPSLIVTAKYCAVAVSDADHSPVEGAGCGLLHSIPMAAWFHGNPMSGILDVIDVVYDSRRAETHSRGPRIPASVLENARCPGTLVCKARLDCC